MWPFVFFLVILYSECQSAKIVSDRGDLTGHGTRRQPSDEKDKENGYSDNCDHSSGKESVDCEVLIIGSGFAGAYAAYQLAPIYGDKLCLVEEQHRDGGRIVDYSETEGGPVFGGCALRVTDTQLEMQRLAETLDMTLQAAEFNIKKYKVRGQYFTADESGNSMEMTEMCLAVFPSTNCTEDPSRGVESDEFILEYLMNLSRIRSGRQLINSYPDIRTLITAIFGEESWSFFREATLFETFSQQTATLLLLELFEQEPADGYFYPVEGMLAYVTRMIRRSLRDGLRLWHYEPVSRISTLEDGTFQVITRSFVINAQKVLSSIPPLGFHDVTGNVAESVKSSYIFRMIKPYPVATVAVWWNKRWWEQSVHGQPDLSHAVSHANCFSKMEIPPVPFIREQNVTRAVYDDGICLEMWRALIENASKEEEMIRVIRENLQNFFDDVEVPEPRTVKGNFAKEAWHLTRPGSSLTSDEILEWAHHPIPVDNFALIGEAYSGAHAAWCNGARITVNQVLERYYGFEAFPKDATTSRTKTFSSRRIRTPFQ